MAMTKTRLRNLVKAIRAGLLLSDHQARRVVDANWLNLSCMDDQPLHDLRIVPVQSAGNIKRDWSGSAYMYVGDDNLGWIEVPVGLMKPILTTSIARAYDCPPEIVAAYEGDIEAILAGANWYEPLELPLAA